MALDKPVRQKKSDRILTRRLPKNEVQCDVAVAPFTRLNERMDRYWGIDRLVELVSPDTASKYGRAISELNDALDDSDPERVVKWAGVCIRGLKAMSEEATNAGHKKASSKVWEFELDGQVFGIMQDGRAWKEVKEQRPEVELLTLREVVLAYRFWKESRIREYEEAAKASFPNAEVLNVKAKTYDDPIKF